MNKPHLSIAHAFWKQIVRPGDLVIDATAGNGHDTLALAYLAGTSTCVGNVIAMDKQQAAIKATACRIKQSLPQRLHPCVRLLQQCHSSFPQDIGEKTVKLIVYNLGYLPGHDKKVTTLGPTTVESLKAASKLICSNGAISITCYPGHPEGKEEEEQVLAFAASLDPKEWCCCHHRWINRLAAPSWLLLQASRNSCGVS